MSRLVGFWYAVCKMMERREDIHKLDCSLLTWKSWRREIKEKKYSRREDQDETSGKAEIDENT